jgi:acyl carrier protein
MTRRTEIAQRLLECLQSDTDLQLDNLDESLSLRGELGIDSVDLVGIIMRLEGDYRIRLTHAELEKVTTVSSLLDLIEHKMAEPAANPARMTETKAA